MSKSVIAHTIFVFLIGCTVQGDVPQTDTNQTDISVSSEEKKEFPVYEEENSYSLYDCSESWQYIQVNLNSVKSVIRLPVPCSDKIEPDKGRPGPNSIRQVIDKSK